MWEDKKYCVGSFKVSVLSAASYTVDWVVYLFLFAFASIWGCLATPKKTEFSITDISVLYTYKPEDETYAPLWYLLILVLILPLIIVIACSIFYLRDKNRKRMLWDIYMAILGAFGCVTSQLFLVVMIKNTASVPRPDFLSRCEPDYSELLDMNILFNDKICLNDNTSLINEGFRSFPSGHSSTIFASQTFLSLFLIGKVKVTAKKYFSWKLLIAILYPLTVSLKISFSRVSDARHRVIDVLMGGLIGLCFGFFFYFLYFSSPFVEKMSLAISPRKFVFSKKHDHWFPMELTYFNIDDNDNDNIKHPYTEAVNEENILKLSEPSWKHGHSTLPVNKIRNLERSVSNPLANYFNIV